MLIKNSRFEIFDKGGGRIGVIVFKPRLAASVNKYLGFPYERGTKFTEGDEAQFTVEEKNAPGLLTDILKLDKDYVKNKFKKLE